MHPMRLLTYALLIGVTTLVAMGGIGFYVGYSAGRGDLSEMKAFLAASISPENAAAVAEAMKRNGGQPAAAPQVDLAPVIEEIRAMGAQIGKLEQAAASSPGQSVVDRLEKIKDDPKMREELAVTRQKLSAATEQYKTCRKDLGAIQVKLDEQIAASQQVALASSQRGSDRQQTSVLYDNVVLKRNQNKVYNDVDIALSLKSVASRSARVVVNQKSFPIAFGERKIVQHGDVTCELVLMETDLDVTQARVSISCKR